MTLSAGGTSAATPPGVEALASALLYLSPAAWSVAVAGVLLVGGTVVLASTVRSAV